MKINNHFQKLGEDFFKPAQPTPLTNQRVVAYSKDVLDLINLSEAEFLSKKFLVRVFGEKKNKDFCNIAQAYSGHQFGHFVETLGDGRALLLCQITDKHKLSQDLVLKGCGLTPFSRPYVQNADGRSVLRSAIREYLASNALHYLKIPTSRALCLIASDEFIQRETVEPAAQIIRVCESHIRFGSFEYFFYRQQNDRVKILADYTIKNYFPRAKNYAQFLFEVVDKTAKMLASWQSYGFCHGVLNTDNMSINGVTLDFGPFAFLDEYDSRFICNASDYQGRYSFRNQVGIVLWNLNAFAITLFSLISMEEIKEILGEFEKIFLENYHAQMAAKLGFSKVDKNIEILIYQTLDLLEKHKIDYTNFFRNLENLEFLKNLSSQNSWKEEIKNWYKFYKPNASHLIKKTNPKFILRNYLLENAIQKAYSGDFSEVEKLQKIMEKPFLEQKEFHGYAANKPAWASDLKISCSS
jgi:uncharacterized protein YdiU (UPF0061 family)